jgi:uncharacterized protein
MPWVPLTDELLGPLVRFIGPRESGCVPFAEQLHNEHRLRLPSRRHFNTVVRLEASGRVSGAILQNLNGVYYPVVDPTRPEIEQEGVAVLFRSSRRVFSILGRSPDVLALQAALPRSPSHQFDYHLMSQSAPPPEVALPRLPRGMTVREVGEEAARYLFDIQKKYEIEEVLLPGNTLNPSATYDHLRQTLREQIVLVAVADGEPIGKVNTNARGIFYDQVGGMYTERRVRSRGVGTALMLRLLQRVAADHKSASLFVKKDNEPALRLYRGIGFAVEDEFRISYYR